MLRGCRGCRGCRRGLGYVGNRRWASGLAVWLCRCSTTRLLDHDGLVIRFRDRQEMPCGDDAIAAGASRHSRRCCTALTTQVSGKRRSAVDFSPGPTEVCNGHGAWKNLSRLRESARGIQWSCECQDARLDAPPNPISRPAWGLRRTMVGSGAAGRGAPGPGVGRTESGGERSMCCLFGRRQDATGSAVPACLGRSLVSAAGFHMHDMSFAVLPRALMLH